MRERFGALGIAPGTQVVVYDADSGMYAARLWWMLRFMGHDAVALLDGGFARWIREGHADARRPRSSGAPATFVGAPREAWRLDADAVAAGLNDPSRVLVDARAEARFRGENETARQEGRSHPRRQELLLPAQPQPTTRRSRAPTSCAPTGWRCSARRAAGPGGDVLRLRRHRVPQPAGAGTRRARAAPGIYPGSWSEWSSDPSRPVATGD